MIRSAAILFADVTKLELEWFAAHLKK